MFDLEQAISEWRRRLTAGGITARLTLDELEAHLRDDIERRAASGTAMSEAFEMAIDQLGTATTLTPEFEKVGTNTTMRPITGIMVGIAALGLVMLGLVGLLNWEWMQPSTGSEPGARINFWVSLGLFFLLILAVPCALAWIGYHIGAWRALVARWGHRRTRLDLVALGVTAIVLLTGVILAVTSTIPALALAGLPITLVVATTTGMLIGLRKSGDPVGKAKVTALLFPATALAAMAWIWYWFAGPGYFLEFNRVKSAIAAVPGVEVLEAGGHHDTTFENIWAHVRVQNKGEIKIHNLTLSSFVDSPRLYLSRIGPYTFRVERWWYPSKLTDRDGNPVRRLSRGLGSWLNIGVQGDFGPQGPFPGTFPFEVRNVQDVVDHFDDICAVLAELADQPEALHFDDPDGSSVTYTIKR